MVFGSAIAYNAELRKKGAEKVTERSLIKEEDLFSFVPNFLEENTTYTMKIKTVLQEQESEWSEETEFTTQEGIWLCAWKECPYGIDVSSSYSVDKKNPRVATKINGNGDLTVIGNTPLPQNKVTSWSVKILKSESNDGSGIYIGVAPSDIDQNEDKSYYKKRGWYIDCYNSTLCSGAPHNYKGKEYGPRKEDGECVHTGDSVGVVMDTTKGELSFAV